MPEPNKASDAGSGTTNPAPVKGMALESMCGIEESCNRADACDTKNKTKSPANRASPPIILH